MHLQIRANPVLSPPDLEKLLDRLATAGVNLLGAGGSNVEFGGEFAFAVEHDQEDLATRTLGDDPPYTYRVFEVDRDPELKLCWLTNSPGQLHDCIAGVASANSLEGRRIRDMVIGVATDEGVPVQIFSEPIEESGSMEQAG